MESNDTPNAKNSQQSGSEDSFSNLYGENYYQFHCGPEPYDHSNPIWPKFFHSVALQIVDELHPVTFLDAGCALGFLVERLRELGVDARGFDISEFAISSAPEALKPFLSLASLTDEIEGTFDVISCIEVLEHLPEPMAESAIGNLCGHTDVVIFSSTPDDFEEPTHLNVRDGDYWAELFASQGFYRDTSQRWISSLTPQAIIFRRSAPELLGTIMGYEAIVTDSIVRANVQATEFNQKISDQQGVINELSRLTSRLSVELGMASKTINQLMDYKLWSEEYRRTKLFRSTIKARHLYGKLRGLNPFDFFVDGSAAEHTHYKQWIDDYEHVINDVSTLGLLSLENKPRISILMPTFNTPPEFLLCAVDSVRFQTYENWELCIADDYSTDAETLAVLKGLESLDSRIKVHYRSENGHISEASNTAFEMATGDWIALLDHDDELASHALASIAVAIDRNQNAVMFYSDRDLITTDGVRSTPYFKSSFDPELALTLNYFCHFQVIKSSSFREIGGFRKGLEGSQDWDLSLRIVERCERDQIIHVPEILYHWRIHEQSVSSSLLAKSYAAPAGLQAVRNHLEATERNSTTIEIRDLGWFSSQWTLPDDLPPVTLVISNRSNRNATHSIEEIQSLSAYPNMELIEIPASSKKEASGGNGLLGLPGDMGFARTANSVMKSTSSEFVCFLDGSFTPNGTDWIELLLGNLLQPEIAVVGPLMFDRSTHFLHTGMICGLNDGVGELYVGQNSETIGDYGRLIATRNFSSVHKDCLFLRKSVWEDVGGFDEVNTPDVYPEVDFCIRAREAGYRTLWVPATSLSQTTEGGGIDQSATHQEALSELAYLKDRWPEYFDDDPFFNQNLDFHQAADPGSTGFSLAQPPRTLNTYLKN
jgi:O-antigen biosynthesis protein